MAKYPSHELLDLVQVEDNGIYLREKFSARYCSGIPGSEVLDWADDMLRVLDGRPTNSSVAVRMSNDGQYIFTFR